jgi:hypothetical protein
MNAIFCGNSLFFQKTGRYQLFLLLARALQIKREHAETSHADAHQPLRAKMRVFERRDWWAALAAFVVATFVFWHHMAQEITLQFSGMAHHE